MEPGKAMSLAEMPLAYLKGLSLKMSFKGLLSGIENVFNVIIIENVVILSCKTRSLVTITLLSILYSNRILTSTRTTHYT